jgi:AbrB family looped-hinge helix DNA binding protein
METIEITSMSSRGQVVIPQRLRESLGLKEGEKFIVLGEDGTLVLKRLETSSFGGFEKLLKKTQEFAKKRGIKESDVEDAINRTKKR